MQHNSSIGFARELDIKDPLKHFRDKFHIPSHYGKKAIYLCGNSLGLQPKVTEQFVTRELEKWKNEAVEGHFRDPDPWVSYHQLGKAELAHLVGGREDEVVAMNNLTTNLHLMLASFYLPSGKRKKIIIESGAFPSDHFAVTSSMEMKGIDPKEDLIELRIPLDGYLSNETIVDNIQQCGDELALVMLPGVQYYTGQFFDLHSISLAARKAGAKVGFDLAHAIGNIPLQLHDDEVDFAVWCSYKYLNSGPGAVAGAFVHHKHGRNTAWPRLAGWWGQREDIRFQMENKFEPAQGVDGWMLSNINIVSNACHLSSLSIFAEAGMENLRKKSVELTGYLEYLLQNSADLKGKFRILTPSKQGERGCQISLFFAEYGKQIFEQLTANGVISDWREPNVIRIAPTPLYNTFEDVHQFATICDNVIQTIGK